MSNTFVSENTITIFLDLSMDSQEFSQSSGVINTFGGLKGSQMLSHSVENSERGRGQKSRIRRMTGKNNLYYRHFHLNEGDHEKFMREIRGKLRWAHMATRQISQLGLGLSQSMINKNEPLATKVRQQSEKVELNLKIIINRSNDEKIIKNRYIIEGHIAESTFSNTYKVGFFNFV